MNKIYTIVFYAIISLIQTSFCQHTLYSEPVKKIEKIKEKTVILYSFECNEFVIPTSVRKSYSTGEIFIVIHGANSSIQECPYLSSMARSILKKYPKSEVWAVDWSLLAKEKAGTPNYPHSVNELCEQSQMFVNYLIHYFPDRQKRENFTKKVPIKYIPLQAASRVEYVCEKIFSQLVSNGMINSSKIRLIGHSLGAHIAFLLAERIKQFTGEKVHSLALLEPAPEFLFERNSSYHGINWKSEAVEHFVAYKTSNIFSVKGDEQITNYIDMDKEGPGISVFSAVFQEYCWHQMAWEVYRSREFDSTVNLKKLKFHHALGLIL